jgi:hypothetical protein
MTMVKLLAREVEAIEDLMPIIYEFYAVAAREESVRKTIQRYFESFSTLLEGVIQVGIERGELRSVPLKETALSLVSLMEGCMLIWILGAFDHGESNLEEMFETSMNLVLEGLMVEG